MDSDKKQKLDEEKNISSLPLEILLKVFCFLKGEEIKNIKLVCKYWFHIAQTPQLRTKLLLQLAYITSKNDVVKVEFLGNRNQKFDSVKIKRCNVDLLFPFFDAVGNDIKYLTIEDSFFSSDSILEKILNSSKNVEQLRVLYCAFQQYSIPKYNKESVKNIKNLEIINKPLTKTKYLETINIIHNLKENNLISFSLNHVYKVFREGNSNNIIHLAQMIRNNNEFLKELSLSDCCFIDEKSNCELWELLKNQGCKLNKLSVSHISPNKGSDKFMEFLVLQKNLTCLILSHVRSLNDFGIEVIVNSLKEIKEFELINCTDVTDKGIILISNWNQLKELNIDFNTEFMPIHKVTIASLINGIARSTNATLRALSLCNIKMKIEELYAVIKNFPNLKKLKCHSINMVVKDEACEILKILAKCQCLEDLSFVNFKKNQGKSLITSYGSQSNSVLKTLDVSYSESCREVLSAIQLPNLIVLKIFYHDDTRQKDNGKEFIKALYDSAKSVEHIKLTVMSDIDAILEFILTNFNKLKSLNFVWHCDNCLLFKTVNIKTNQKLHPLIKKSSLRSLQFDESCDRCNSLFTKLKEC